MGRSPCALLGALIGGSLVAGFPNLVQSAPPERLPEVVSATIEDIMATVRRPGARAVLVNVWATWCEPCVAEMPDILRFYTAHRDQGLRLVLVSADPAAARKKVARFLGSRGFELRSYRKTGGDMAFINGLDPRWDGTLPASVLFDGNGRRQHLWSGPVTYDALKKELAQVLAKSPGPMKKGTPMQRSRP